MEVNIYDKHILVTGGAGFIGSHIVDYLLRRNLKVLVIDNLSTGNMNNLKKAMSDPNFKFVYGSITDLELLRKHMKYVGAVCHQAALGSVPRSIDDPLSSHNSNVNGFLNILVIMKEYNIKRIVYASSSSVYGDSIILPKTEEIIGKPLSPYAITKYIDELYANNFSKLYGIEAIGLRYFNVFGPRQDPNGAYAAVIPKFIKSLIDKKRVTINGDGTFSRDFTHVSNIVRANCLALTTDDPKCYGEIFNIGAGGRVSLEELYNYISSNLNSGLEPIYGEERIGDIPHSNADITKAEEMLGYKVEGCFNDYIRDTINYYRSI